MPLPGLSIFGDAVYRIAARPLFDAGEVEAIEWTVNSWMGGNPHDETAALLKTFGASGKLIGHGVFYPVLDAAADALRADWLAKLALDVKTHSYCGVSVHFGFSTGWQISEGAPLPVPYCEGALETGRDALKKLASVTPCKVGLENLALSFSAEEAGKQGQFLRELLAPVNGYLLLDLHNVYCQSVNFGVPLLDMVKTYPLELVEEIHCAGGAWSEHGGSKVRRDTHDGRLPQEILDALPAVIKLCPRVKFVLFEKLPTSFENDGDAAHFREDYLRMARAVKHAG